LYALHPYIRPNGDIPTRYIDNEKKGKEFFFITSVEIKERKNRVCIRLFFFPSFIVLNRLDVFILRLVCLY
jgi:hypothetical protein